MRGERAKLWEINHLLSPLTCLCWMWCTTVAVPLNCSVSVFRRNVWTNPGQSWTQGQKCASLTVWSDLSTPASSSWTDWNRLRGAGVHSLRACQTENRPWNNWWDTWTQPRVCEDAVRSWQQTVCCWTVPSTGIRNIIKCYFWYKCLRLTPCMDSCKSLRFYSSSTYQVVSVAKIVVCHVKQLYVGFVMKVMKL